MSGQDHKGQEPVNPRIFPLPPVVFMLFLASGYVLQQIIPLGGGKPAMESVIAGNVLMVIGFVIALLAAWAMSRRERRSIRAARHLRWLLRASTAARATRCI